MATTNVPVTLETPITIKIAFQDQTKKFKLPVKDLGAHVLPDRVSASLAALSVLFRRASGPPQQPG